MYVRYNDGSSFTPLIWFVLHVHVYTDIEIEDLLKGAMYGTEQLTFSNNLTYSICIVGVSTVRSFVISFNNGGTSWQASCMEQDDLHFRIIRSTYSFVLEYLLFDHFLFYFIDNLRFTGVLCSIDCDFLSNRHCTFIWPHVRAGQVYSMQHHMWLNMSVTCKRSMVFSRYSGFHQQ